jgi:large subunit ribosomal protein L10
MPITREQKANKIDKIKEEICKSSVAIVTDYRGLTVEEITALRRSLQEVDAEYSVVKNTLADIAVKDTNYEALQGFLTGPTALVLGRKDQVAPAKVLTQFIKKAKKVSIKGGVLDGSVLNEDQVKQLADIPSIEELYAKMLGSINSPATGIATCINNVMRNMVVCIDEVRKQKEAQG